VEGHLKFKEKDKKQGRFLGDAWFLRLGGNFTGDGLTYLKNESTVHI
jgi:hypothetical protein